MKIEDDAEFVLSSARVSYFSRNILFKIPIDLGLMCFERKFNSLQFLQKYRKPNFKVFLANIAIHVAAEYNYVFLSIFLFFEFFMDHINLQKVFERANKMP